MATNLNGIFIIPTGLGCSLGGDAAFNPGVKLIATCSKNLIVNPNAVNASDINELPTNALYVEGSTIDRFLEGALCLRKIKTHNRILVAVNTKSSPTNINAMNAGVWGLGADAHLLTLNTPLKMKAVMNLDGTAGGVYSGIEELVQQVKEYDYDALALHTPIECDTDVAKNYWVNGGVNPWGGVEAIVSKLIAEKINKPVAHAPIDPVAEDFTYANLIVKRSMAPEIISNTYLFCVLKGLHRSPRLELIPKPSEERLLRLMDIDFMVSPHGCWGRSHKACRSAGIPIIVVKENRTCFSSGFTYPDTTGIIFVNNYLEAAGVLIAMHTGVDYRTILVRNNFQDKE